MYGAVESLVVGSVKTYMIKQGLRKKVLPYYMTLVLKEINYILWLAAILFTKDL
jgi:hypothetical protein